MCFMLKVFLLRLLGNKSYLLDISNIPSIFQGFPGCYFLIFTSAQFGFLWIWCTLPFPYQQQIGWKFEKFSCINFHFSEIEYFQLCTSKIYVFQDIFSLNTWDWDITYQTGAKYIRYCLISILKQYFFLFFWQLLSSYVIWQSCQTLDVLYKKLSLLTFLFYHDYKIHTIFNFT